MSARKSNTYDAGNVCPRCGEIIKPLESGDHRYGILDGLRFVAFCMRGRA